MCLAVTFVPSSADMNPILGILHSRVLRGFVMVLILDDLLTFTKCGYRDGVVAGWTRPSLSGIEKGLSQLSESPFSYISVMSRLFVLSHWNFYHISSSDYILIRVR